MKDNNDWFIEGYDMSMEDLLLIAEDRLNIGALNFGSPEIFSVKEVDLIVHELKTHQIELEMQNEELKRAYDELEHSRTRYFELYNFAPEGYLILSAEGLIIEANLNAATMLGCTVSSLIKNGIFKYIHIEDQDTYYLHNKKLFETLTAQECELRMIKNDGSLFWGHMKAIIVIEKGISTCRLILSDITKRVNTEVELNYLNYHDELTGVYNRRFYEEELKRHDTERNLPFSIVLGDLNGLKLINDSFGHCTGDELIKEAAMAIEKVCRADDIIARIGGDEFVIILPKTDSFEAEKLVARIAEVASEKKVGNIQVSISFGYETKVNKSQNLNDIFKSAEDHMYRHKLYKNSSIKNDMMGLIMNALFEKNPRELLHSKRVGNICEAIAKSMNFNKDDIIQIKIAGLLHDMGKIGIDERILNSPERLDELDRKEVERHSEIVYRILSSCNELSEIAKFALDHHERWDGLGYPKGLKGEEISLPARIIAIADSFDAMTSSRVYADVLNEEDALNEILRCAGTQFDPEIAKMFAKQFRK